MNAVPAYRSPCGKPPEMAVEGLEALPALWGDHAAYFREHARLYRAHGPVTEFPAPEVVGEWLNDLGQLPVLAPTAVRRLVKHAGTHGWETLVRYARGNRQHLRTAKPLGPAHSLAVAMRHPDTPVRAVAVTFCPVHASGWKWAPFLTSRNGALASIGTYTQFTDYLMSIKSDSSVLDGGS